MYLQVVRLSPILGITVFYSEDRHRSYFFSLPDSKLQFFYCGDTPAIARYVMAAELRPGASLAALSSVGCAAVTGVAGCDGGSPRQGSSCRACRACNSAGSGVRHLSRASKIRLLGNCLRRGIWIISYLLDRLPSPLPLSNDPPGRQVHVVATESGQRYAGQPTATSAHRLCVRCLL